MSFALLSICCALTSSIVALATHHKRFLGAITFVLLGLAGMNALIAAGLSLINGTVEHGLWGPAWLPWAVRLDPIAGFFLLIVGILTLAVSSYAPDYVR